MNNQAHQQIALQKNQCHFIHLREKQLEAFGRLLVRFHRILPSTQARRRL